MADLELLRKIGRYEEFPGNKVVFFQDDVGTSIYFVLKGTFGVYINNISGFPIRVAEIAQGSVFGEVAAIDEGRRSATIVSQTDGAALVIEKDNLGQLLAYAPDIGASIAATLRRRIESTTEMLQIAGRTVPALTAYAQIEHFKNAQSNLSVLKLLAQDLRKLNEQLTASPGAPARSAPPEIPPQEAARLLPEDYTSLNKHDDYCNNSRMLLRKDYDCPCCAMKLEAHVPLLSVIKPRQIDLDGRVTYEGFDILRYTNIICPHCCYTDTYQEFGKSSAASIQAEYSASGSPFKTKEGFSGYADANYHTLDETVLSYYSNILCLNLTTGDPLRLANAWIRLYWIFRDYGKNAYAKQASKNALSHYERFLDENGKIMPIDDRMRLGAIAGELSAAVGDFEKARKYYEQNIDIGKDLKNDMLRDHKNRYKELKRSVRS